MQQRGCQEIELLISKYADGEATTDERRKVDHHVAGCTRCAYKLTSYLEAAAVFSETPMRQAEPQLRAGLFREIGRLKEEDKRTASKRSWWTRPASGERPNGPMALPSRLWQIASPFAIVSAVALAFFGLLALNTRNAGVAPGKASTETIAEVLPVPAVPTIPPPINVSMSSGMPGALMTKLPGLGSPTISAVEAPVRASATFVHDAVLKLARATPIFEADPAQRSPWHLLHDATYGYNVSYPMNWWTRVQDNTRSFFPWSAGGTQYAPYWIEISALKNVDRLTADTGNKLLLGGKGTVMPGANGLQWVRYSNFDRDPVSDELYSFGAAYYFVLKLYVPKESTLMGFQERWAAGQDVFSRMSGKISFSSEEPGALSKAPIVFLNGTDLWITGMSDRGAQRITLDQRVRSFALSPDLRQVVFTAAGDAGELWGKDIYLTHINAGALAIPRLLWSGAEVHDLAWYGEHDLLAIAKDTRGRLGLFNLGIDSASSGRNTKGPAAAGLKTELDDTMSGARGLAVAPDRQLVTFLAPLSKTTGMDSGIFTDIYAVRPDGTNLQQIVTHTEAAPSRYGNRPGATQSAQAVKSYVWMDGHLEAGGYQFNLLFTAGNALSPSLYRGGSLYAMPGAEQGPVLDPSSLGVDDPDNLQIVHLAYSPSGKLAFTGYYTNSGDRADQLVGLWVADVSGNKLANIRSMAIPGSHHGIADLQWEPSGDELVYRETMQDAGSQSSRYDGQSPFNIIELEPATGTTTVLYDGSQR